MAIAHRSTSEELANPGGVTRDEVLERLRDWRDRVHGLYDQIQEALESTSFKCNREGKYTSAEELPQRVGVPRSEQPQIDILRIVRPDGTNAAVLQPRGLWIIGANGRIDLRIIPATGAGETYMVVDQSPPFTRPAQWVRMPIGSPFDREPFDPHWLMLKLH
jgi:hypothetical protein